MIAPDLSAALRPVLDVLQDLGVRHLVCGSIASSAHGVPRASIDADVVAELGPEHADRLVASLAERYYVPEGQVRDAIRQRSSFSVIHLDTMVKVDVFVAGDSPGDREELGRWVVATLDDAREIPVASAEDTVLAKLQWFRRGGEVSERQWTDVVGLLRVVPTLDEAYLRSRATRRGVTDLLDRAWADAGKS